MPRYIDSDWIYQMVENRYRVSSGIEHRCERDLLDLICQAPTADVVPKSEVERLKDDNKFLQDRRFKELSDVRRETARGIFEEIEERIATHCFTSKSEDYADGMYDAVAWVDSKLAEIKKKYQEGEPNGENIKE